MTVEEQLRRIRGLASYKIVLDNSKKLATNAEHYFDCCILIHDIHKSFKDVLDKVWDELARGELRDLESFLDPKVISASKNVGKMLYGYRPQWTSIRGKFNKSSLLKLSEQDENVQRTIFRMEFHRADPLPSKLAVKALEDLCRSQGKGEKDKKEKKPFELVGGQLGEILSSVIKNLGKANETIGASDFSTERSMKAALPLHELIGAIDVQTMQIKSHLTTKFREVPWYARFKK